MMQIALLLTGSAFVRRSAPLLMLLGLLWGGLGLSIFIDGLQGERHFPLHIFGTLLLVDSIISILLGSCAKGAQRGVFYFKGGIFCFIALIVLSGRHGGNLVLAIIFGLAYFITGVFVIASAIVVRYTRWKSAVFAGVTQIAFAIFLFLPWPTNHDGTISQFFGMVLLTGGINALRLSLRMFKVRNGRSVFDILAPADLLLKEKTAAGIPAAFPPGNDTRLIVHVWTPEGSAANDTLPRPILNRYIAAVDANGVISTGHAALEIPPSLYISLYPAEDIDRSPSEFFNTLKAVQENTVKGKYQESYAVESKAWCDSDRKVIFNTFNADALRDFWGQYRTSETYNLTWRNCSSSVAYALEAALDGALKERANWLGFLRLFVIPELWIAAQLRKRATTMAWTPGLVLDYARALQTIVNQENLSIMRFVKSRLRQSRAKADD